MGWILGRLFRYRRGEVIQTIQGCFPEKDITAVCRLVDDMYANLGQVIIETLRFGLLSPEWMERHIEFHGMELIQAELRRGRGAIMLTAHIGNFQLPAMIAGFWEMPITIIIKNLKPAALNEYWAAIRRRLSVKSLPHHGSFRACLAVLKANEILGFMLDQNMKRHEGIFVEFFGRPACTSPGLAYLSALSGSPVIPVFITRRHDGTHRIDVMPAMSPPADRQPETIHQATQAYTAIIESAIRKHPDQWIWIHRRWRTQPQPDIAVTQPKA